VFKKLTDLLALGRPFAKQWIKEIAPQVLAAGRRHPRRHSARGLGIELKLSAQL
jgi:hypothetical protein